ncbi:hypothetical protein MHYP_G00185200 [Metynnis hypsauchen]
MSLRTLSEQLNLSSSMTKVYESQHWATCKVANQTRRSADFRSAHERALRVSVNSRELRRPFTPVRRL